MNIFKVIKLSYQNQQHPPEDLLGERSLNKKQLQKQQKKVLERRNLQRKQQKAEVVEKKLQQILKLNNFCVSSMIKLINKKEMLIN